MVWDRRAPFDTNGSLMHHPGSYMQELKEMRPEKIFRATMTYTGFERGRSAAYTMWKDEKGRTYPMFLAELHDTLPLLVKGSLNSTWRVTKRGQNFGIKLAKELPSTPRVKTSCAQCTPDNPVSHNGSSLCRMRTSIASGGKNTHCTCRACF